MRHTYPGPKPLLHALVDLMPGHRHSPVAARGPGAGPPPGLPPWPLSPCLQRDWPEQALAPRCARPRPGQGPALPARAARAAPPPSAASLPLAAGCLDIGPRASVGPSGQLRGSAPRPGHSQAWLWHGGAASLHSRVPVMLLGKRCKGR